MTTLRKFTAWVSVASLVLCPSGCVTTSTPPPPLPSDKADALRWEYAKAEAVERGDYPDIRERKAEQLGKKDQLDQWLRVASMAIDAGEPERAREILTRVTEKMAVLLQSDEYARSQEEITRVVGGEEIEKYFWGDPYERMFAYLYLGILDFQAGEYAAARDAFRTATLMDRTISQDAFKGDSYLAYLLEAIAERFAADSSADQSFLYAEDAFAFRQHIALLATLLYDGVVNLHLDRRSEADQALTLSRLDLLMPIVATQIPVALLANNEPRAALQNAFDIARQQVQEGKSTGEEGDPVIEVLKLKRGSAQAQRSSSTAGAPAVPVGGDAKSQVLNLLSEYQQATISALTDAAMEPVNRARQEFSRVVTVCKDTRTNTFILNQAGRAPAKVRAGKYGNARVFYSYPNPVHHSMMTLSREGVEDSLVLASLMSPVESLDFQARTRGGREMDQILEGKVVFRDATRAASNLSYGVANVAMVAAYSAATTVYTTTTVTYTVAASGEVTATTTTTSSMGGMAAAAPFLTVAAAAFLTYEIFKVTSNSIHPEADFRAWHELPANISFVCAAVEPGDYALRVDSFDRLARPLPQEKVDLRFTAPAGKPTLVLAGKPWN